MARGAKPTPAKTEAKSPVGRKPRNREGIRPGDLQKRLAEASEQHAAISEILRVISSSPGDVTPVLATVAERAAHLCDASFAQVLLVEGNVLRPTVAYWADGGSDEEHADSRGVKRTWPLARSVMSGRAVLDCETIHYADVVPLLNSEYPDVPRAKQQELGFRAVLVVPLMREGGASGVIFIFRREPRPFSPEQVTLVETFARQAAIAIENVRLFNETEEALEQQTATSEILRVISSSPTDVQPVFETIAAAALKLCRASSGNVHTFDGELIHLAAIASLDAEGAEALRKLWPRPPSRDTAVTRAILTRTIVVIPDVLDEPDYKIGATAAATGFRSVLAVPLLREGSAIGCIAVGRPEPGPFPDKQVALLQTFADQAVIAIENVRLFNETKEALEQQTATSEILQVISTSPGDVKPVLNAVAERALRLCDAEDATIFLLEGDKLRSAARLGSTPQAIEKGECIPVTRGWITGRAVIDRTAIYMEDLATASEEEFPLSREMQRQMGHHAVVSVPLMREDRAIGAIALWRMEARRFTDKQIALVKTFADQAAIAIENARLFNETKEALEQQTATSEILGVISRSPTDVQPVFATIASAAQRLCAATSANLFTFDGQLLHLAAHARSISGSNDAADSLGLRTNFPRPPDRDLAGPRAVLTCSVVSIPDVLADTEYKFKDSAVAGGFRSVLAVPLIRDGAPMGAIVVGRPEPGQFPDRQLALLQTFAAQAVIAIENVRLFDEVQARARELSVSLQQQTATADVLKVISRSAFDLQKVLDTLTESACKLCDAEGANIWRPDGDGFKVAAMFGHAPEHRAALKRVVNKPGRATCVGRALLEGRTVHIRDAKADPEYNAPDVLAARGNRAMMGVPLLREGAPIGVLVLTRTVAQPFTEKQIALATTFADQAVIAIENVRLFNETKEALEQQTATSEILRVISRSPTDVQPVFDTIAEAALRLCRASSALVATFDGELVRLAALAKLKPDGADAIRNQFPRPASRETGITRAILMGSAVEIPDVLEDPEYVTRVQALRGEFRSILAVPLMRDGRPIGGISVGRAEAGRFPDKQIALLMTFADQALIAIENVRLFTELEVRTIELTRSVGELKALGEVGQAVSSTLDLGTVLSTIVSRATQLAGMNGGAIHEYDESREEFHLRATDHLPNDLIEALHAAPIAKGEGATGRLAVTREPVEIRDMEEPGAYDSRVRDILLRHGYRSLLAVPLLREDHLLGGLIVTRNIVGAFAPEVVDLLKTFATQSALAIQNARLFREIEVKSRELEAASRHKSEFLANMSHELRTPLNAIIGFSEVLSERMFGEINEKQAEYIGDILQSGQHLLSLINDILDLSKIEAGRVELELSEFDLASTIENTLILVRERAQRRGIILSRTIDERLGSIRADELKVKQVLLNLLSNALKFTPEGGTIDVRAAVNDGAAEISVTDTGIGISPADQEAVFEEFRQVGAASRKVEGTGLGLAISRKFIELHGGRIWVESAVGSGSTFAFILPLR